MSIQLNGASPGNDLVSTVTLNEVGIWLNDSQILLGNFVELAGKLSAEDLSRLSRTCKVFHDLITSNENFLAQIVAKNWEILFLATPDLMQNPSLQQLAFRCYNDAVCGNLTSLANLIRLPFLPKRQDKGFVLAAVEQDAFALYYASEELKADRGVVLAAITQRGAVLCYASEKLKADRDVVLAAVTRYGGALRHASKELRADKEVVLTAVAQDGIALMYASEELQADREVVLAAVAQNSRALCHASPILRNDPEFMEQVCLD